MTILQQPDALSLSGNLKDFRISTIGTVSFILLQNENEILSQSYDPSNDGITVISLKDIVHSLLSFQLQETSLIYQQSSIVGTFTARFSDEGVVNPDTSGQPAYTNVTFRVLRAGIDCFADTATNFLTHNFLTWQPSVKPVTYYTPEFLTYYAVVSCTAKLHAYFTDASGVVTSEQEISLSTFDAGKAYTIPLQYASVAEKLGNKLPAYYDVWIENFTGSRLSYVQRYYATDMFSEQEQWVLFENSLGGIDTFRAYGSCDFTGEHTHNIAEIGEVSSEYRVDTERKFQKNTGHLNDLERRWLLDFFPSLSKYIHTGSYLRPIIVVESNVTYTDRDLPSNYTFTYKYADARPLLNLSRVNPPTGELNITVPDLGSFTVPPRLVEFPRIPLSEGVLFPVQNPYSKFWSTSTAGSLGDFIAERLAQNYGGGGGVGHLHGNIDLLQLLSYVDEYLLIAGRKIKAGYADKAGYIDGLEDMFLRKDRPDFTPFLLKLLAGIEIGPAIDSLALGKGIIADALGRLQVGRLEVRDSLTVQELIFNRLSAMESDYPFSESGTIESIEKIDDTTYRLPLRKRWENDFTGIGENDVVYGIVNNLASGGGEYYTCWLRVLNVNTVTNTITVVMYPDGEVPGGKNYPPEPLMLLSHRGNPVNKERQGYWYLSSREKCICMLDGVIKPILEESNYAIIIGRLKHLSLFDNLPINYLHSYVYCRGIAIQDLIRINYQGQVIRQERFRGEWSSEIAVRDEPYIVTNEIVDIVYYIGCKWQCLVSNTIQAPCWNATDWAMIEGNSDLTMRFISSNGDTFFAGRVSTNVTPSVYWGYSDISNDVADVDWTWTRNTGNITEDNVWNTAHSNNGRVLILSNNDIGSNWGTSRRTEFICTAYVRDGEGVVLESIVNKVIA